MAISTCFYSLTCDNDWMGRQRPHYSEAATLPSSLTSSGLPWTQGFILFYSILFHSIPFYSILFYSIPFYSVPVCSVLFRPVPYCVVLYCAMLCCTVLCYTMHYCHVTCEPGTAGNKQHEVRRMAYRLAFSAHSSTKRCAAYSIAFQV